MGDSLSRPAVALTSQQAADLLGVSRPTVKRWIEKGELPAELVGKRFHRLRLDDVLRYREARRRQQYEALAASAVDIDVGDDPEVVLERLRAVRQASARRGRPPGRTGGSEAATPATESADATPTGGSAMSRRRNGT
ncbi:helix-turn-helix domain-containing protein [Nocardia sp. BMG111209]|uniref:helix-turn-helix domain-containing protein n=1 Tax=Nocardia sp. BMG111209 TaxID=1160137 RepID=UPI00037DBC7E|nr:helix-turn-helix domain-containing protein [Nocardia sp. BMG111209]